MCDLLSKIEYAPAVIRDRQRETDRKKGGWRAALQKAGNKREEGICVRALWGGDTDERRRDAGAQKSSAEAAARR